MGRYAGYALGLMEFKIDNVDVKIKPQMKDVDEALRLLAKSKMENMIPIPEIKKFCINLLLNGLEKEEQEEPTSRKETEEFVTINLLHIWVEIQIAFKLLDRDVLNKNGER